jgi:hypothetical protein
LIEYGNLITTSDISSLLFIDESRGDSIWSDMGIGIPCKVYLGIAIILHLTLE